MEKHDSYKILLKNREGVTGRKICEIISDLLLDRPIPATYGYFFLQHVFLDCRKLLIHLKDYEKTLGEDQCRKLKQLCEEEVATYGEIHAVLIGFEIEEKLGLKTKDLGPMLISPYPESLKFCIAHVFLFTKNLLNMKGGLLIDPTGNDGLYRDLKNAKKFYKAILELREWETNKLWDSVWEPFGGPPSDQELENIPDEDVPFEIEEIAWEWEWENSKGKTIYGYVIDIRDLRVHPNETLEKLEKRIDQAIKPIKKHLSKEKPSLSNW